MLRAFYADRNISHLHLPVWQHYLWVTPESLKYDQTEGEIEVSVEFKQPCVVSGYHLAKRGSGAASQRATVLSYFSETSLLLFEWGISKEKYLVYLVSEIDFD